MKKDRAVSDGVSASISGLLSSGQEITQETISLPIESWLLRRALYFLGRPNICIVLWDGKTISLPGTRIVSHMHIRDRKALYKLISNPHANFGDLYSQGRIDIEGSLIETVQSFIEATDRTDDDAGVVRKQLNHFLVRPPRENSLMGSRKNIHHHYDISNDFYKLWLDKDYMQYTCAYYPEADMSLEQAQAAKLEHVCRKLALQPGETVVEAGCGWGGLARYMAKHYGVKVKSYNISHQQILYAREQATRAGLRSRIEYIEDDYRNISGKFDAFVSVGMLEHVGHDNYQQLGNVINRCLKPDGRGLIHSIGRNRPALMNPWIEKRIFPGAYPPALKEMMDIFEPSKFSVLDVENLRLHYAKTLRHWLERYEQHATEIEESFDSEFARAWRFYLASSIAAFNYGRLQLFQLLFTRQRNNNVFATRARLYHEPPPESH